MAFANFSGRCQLDPALGKPIVCAAGFQAQAYVFRFSLISRHLASQIPPRAKTELRRSGQTAPVGHSLSTTILPSRISTPL